MTISTEEFRRVLGHYASGITVVTAVVDGQAVGMTCQSFFSLSMDPPLIAFAPSKSSRSYADIRQSKSFCINVLSEGQRHISNSFARSNSDKFEGVDWKTGKTGSPILLKVLSWIDCEFEAEHDAGDHYLVIGRVVEMSATEQKPLLYFQGKYAEIAVKQTA